MGSADDRDMELVAIGTVGDPIEGAMTREYLASCGIECIVQGEHHRSMLQIMGTYIELRLLVPRYQAEEAVALLRDFRRQLQSEAASESAEGEEPGDEDESESEGDDGESEALDWRDDAERARHLRRARFVALAMPGFGLGHFAVGARARGLILMATWPATFMLITTSMELMAMTLVPLSAALDFFGAPSAMADVQSSKRERLPRARALSGTRDDDHSA
jgi:Putative prokaryotic signal transducing protein